MQNIDLEDSYIVPAAVTTSAIALSYLAYRQMLSPPVPRALPPVLTKEVDRATCERTSIIPDLDQPYVDNWKGYKTAYECFQTGLRLGPSNKCLGQRPGPTEPYHWLSYSDVSQKVKRMGSGLIAKGFKSGQDTLVGIFAQNSTAWHSTMQMSNHYSMVLVPLYDTLGVEAVQFILSATKLRVVFTDKKRLEMLVKYLTASSHVSHIILTDGCPTTEQQEQVSGVGIDIISLDEIEKCGEAAPRDFVPPQPSDIALICYTSGTTGTPKGAMITHQNISRCCIGVEHNLWGWPHSHNDRMISYLPCAHVYEYALECYFTQIGGSIGFYQGNIKLLLDDIQQLKPTVFPSVPRVLNKLHDKIIEDIAKKPTFVQWLINKATKSKLQEVELGIIRQNSIWDYLIFNKIRKLLGGNIRLVITGSAPLAPNILQWYRSVLGCHMIEGYGQTENCGICTISLFGDTIPGHVGVPAPGVSIKLHDVPHMNYRTSEGKGEICVKGPTVFKGYFNEPEKTKETIDSEGWLHTGDIGTWTEHGCVRIIDRKKSIFKLAQGEYVAPEKIEMAYEANPIIAQCFVFGDSLKATLVGIVVPDDLAVKRRYGDNVKLADICKSEDFYNDIMLEMKNTGGPILKGFEQIKKIYLYPELFTVDNDLATPTFKKKRSAITERFKTELDALYEGLD